MLSWLLGEKLFFKDSWTEAYLQKRFFSMQMDKTKPILSQHAYDLHFSITFAVHLLFYFPLLPILFLLLRSEKKKI